jgi:hypothetical protein
VGEGGGRRRVFQQGILLCLINSLRKMEKFTVTLSRKTYILAQSGDSKAVLKLSRSVPKVPSFRRTAAVILDASGPPPGCFRLRSCKMEIAHMKVLNRIKAGGEARNTYLYQT